MTKVIKVGDYVGFKSDIEQTGEVVKIERNGGWNGRQTIYYVRAFQGEYVDNVNGSILALDADEIW